MSGGHRVYVSPSHLTLQRASRGGWIDLLAWRRFYTLDSPYFYGELRDFETYCERQYVLTDEDLTTDFHEDA